MLFIKIADITVQIDNKYEYVARLCEKYTVPPVEMPDMCVSVSESEIDEEISVSEINPTRGYAEGICVYRNICKRLPSVFDGYLMHCAVIEYKGEGYAFAAKSGTGKTTHIGLWRRRFGDEVKIVNGDKPILRFSDNGRLYAYGTPWCGKEGLNRNVSVPLKAICFIERAAENSIRRISPSDALMRVFHQILSPDTEDAVDKLFPLLDRTLAEVPCYVLGCNISEEAAEVAYNGMNEL